MRKATHLALILLLVAGLGVFAASAEAQSAPQKKSAASSSAKKSHRKKASRKLRRWEKGQKVPAPSRITEIQQALASKGYMQGSPSGVWDTSSVEALKKFQQDQSLEPSGKIDSLSLIALGLGPKRDSPPAPQP